ncbi:hypothetical protein [Armatimonas rosea]|uniref:Uncharacterized protein n=1 Tax=Armatimonas rosea TaxID=685828 RepID=A0A7W9W911_ARMRO|nr:hypothetical protein [Armatimonas rosea]MBB6054124.1 hypothetical protein [Armatimonas rosea]
METTAALPFFGLALAGSPAPGLGTAAEELAHFLETTLGKTCFPLVATGHRLIEPDGSFAEAIERSEALVTLP